MFYRRFNASTLEGGRVRGGGRDGRKRRHVRDREERHWKKRFMIRKELWRVEWREKSRGDQEVDEECEEDLESYWVL